MDEHETDTLFSDSFKALRQHDQQRTPGFAQILQQRQQQQVQVTWFPTTTVASLAVAGLVLLSWLYWPSEELSLNELPPLSWSVPSDFLLDEKALPMISQIPDLKSSILGDWRLDASSILQAEMPEGV